MTEHAKNMIDWISVGTAISAFIGALPAIASLLSIVWTLIRIYEYFKKGE